MPLSNPDTIGDQIDAAIQAIGITGGTPITPTQRKKIWRIVVEKIYADIQANLGVDPGTFVVSGAGIIAPSGGGPCSGSSPVTGVGGPGV